MVEEMIKYIYKLNEEELTQLVYAIKDRRDILRYDNLKTIGLKEDGRPWVRWRCSPSLLTKLGENE